MKTVEFTESEPRMVGFNLQAGGQVRSGPPSFGPRDEPPPPSIRDPQFRRVVVAGQSVGDVPIQATAVRFGPHHLEVAVSGMEFRIRTAEPMVTWGGKVTALDPHPEALLACGGETGWGGGGVNTVLTLAELRTRRRLPWDLAYLDLTVPKPGLEAELGRRGIDFLSLGRVPAKLNLVVTLASANGANDRIVVRGPGSDPVGGGVEWSSLEAWFRCHRHILVLNSLRDVATVQKLVTLGQAGGVRQYSVLTSSLLAADRRDLLAAHDRFSICNLAEFVQLVEPLGIRCPGDEHQADLGEIGQALLVYAALVRGGGHIITLGARGQLVGDPRTGAVWHVSLRAEYQDSVRQYVALHREVINRSGDIFAAGFLVTEELGCATPRAPSRAAAAALAASVEVLRGYGLPEASEDWFTVEKVVDGFVRNTGTMPAAVPEAA